MRQQSALIRADSARGDARQHPNLRLISARLRSEDGTDLTANQLIERGMTEVIGNGISAYEKGVALGIRRAGFQFLYEEGFQLSNGREVHPDLTVGMKIGKRLAVVEAHHHMLMLRDKKFVEKRRELMQTYPQLYNILASPVGKSDLDRMLRRGGLLRSGEHVVPTLADEYWNVPISREAEALGRVKELREKEKRSERRKKLKAAIKHNIDKFRELDSLPESERNARIKHIQRGWIERISEVTSANVKNFAKEHRKLGDLRVIRDEDLFKAVKRAAEQAHCKDNQ
ncbi:MAG: hypothetical protein KGI04_03700 [Candidatus Micrarchaeota archaeon]|nr:hypothetical protein [Candidatus Micrarchaeota archaeon]